MRSNLFVKSSLLLSCFFIVMISVFGASEHELEKQLNKTRGLERTEILLQLFYRIYKEEPNKASLYVKEALQIAETQNNDSLLANALLANGLFFNA